MKATYALATALLFATPLLYITTPVHAQGSDESYGPKTSLWWPRLKSGQHGYSVKALQRLLTARGMKVRADGTFGPATQNAVRAYQKQHGLQVDGIVGWQTWENVVPPVGRGSHGRNVVVLQTLLNEQGHHLRVDGAYGPSTEKAVKTVGEEVIIPLQNGRVTSAAWCYLVGGHIDGE